MVDWLLDKYNDMVVGGGMVRIHHSTIIGSAGSSLVVRNGRFGSRFYLFEKASLQKGLVFKKLVLHVIESPDTSLRWLVGC